MLYILVKLIAKFSFLAAYRKVYFINEDLVPDDRAVLMTCNHPNGFVEPLVIGGYIPQDIHFLVRGDVFKSTWAATLLRLIHCIPIFRFRDGFASMRKNNETLDSTVEILAKKSTLLVFAEGSTQQTRYVRPIQKGTIRLAFDTLSKYPEANPCIVPSFIHFTNPKFYRSDVVVEYSKPINLSDYQELYNTHPAKAIKKLLDIVNEKMQALSIKIDPPVSTEDADLVLEIARSSARDNNIYPIISRHNNLPYYNVEKNASRVFNEMEENKKTTLIQKIKSLKANIQSSGFSYRQIASNTKSIFFNIVFLILGFVPFLIGKIFNIIPVGLAKRYARGKVRKIEFIAVIKLCSFLIFYPIYLIILGVVITSVFTWKIALTVLVLPFLGWFAFLWEGQWKDLVQTLKYNKDKHGSLKNQYKAIVQELSVSAA